MRQLPATCVLRRPLLYGQDENVPFFSLTLERRSKCSTYNRSEPYKLKMNVSSRRLFKVVISAEMEFSGCRGRNYRANNFNSNSNRRT